jgi:hypothetical protein
MAAAEIKHVSVHESSIYSKIQAYIWLTKHPESLQTLQTLFGAVQAL